ncbi:uncharacterized protein LOC108098301 [Drosophila ficusphila]|uniref:uncharacterized protein LOC108098301 n=1 Tax=Drosophila ficusphila TaxID=30025 RepID=UPI0007E65CFE|nr:uncharacterized protein LOC108098301 [Drosophila ficusphila]
MSGAGYSSETMANRITWTFLFVLAALQSSYGTPPVNRLPLRVEPGDELFQMETENLEKLKNVLQLVIDEAELTLPPDSQGSILPKLKEMVSSMNSVDVGNFTKRRNYADALKEMKNILEMSKSKELESEADKVTVNLYFKHGVGLKVILESWLLLELGDELFQMETENMEALKNVLKLVIEKAELTLPPDSQGNILPKLKEMVSKMDSVDVDNFAKRRNYVDALKEMKNILEMSKSKELESEADKAIVKLYIKHAVGLKVILEKNVETTLKVIEKKMESHMSTWSQSRLDTNSELVKQFNEFKNEKDVYRKLRKIKTTLVLFGKSTTL